MTCLRHRFSGFVWQQEARPLSILETNKPEKPLQPSEPPQRNPAPTWLRKTFTRQRKKKVFISSARNCASKRSFVPGRLGTLPVSVTARECPPPHGAQERYLAACSGLSSAGARGGGGGGAAAAALRGSVCPGSERRRRHPALGSQPHCGRGRGGMRTRSANRTLGRSPGNAESATHAKLTAPSSGAGPSPRRAAKCCPSSTGHRRAPARPAKALLHPTLHPVAEGFTSCLVPPSPASPLLTPCQPPKPSWGSCREPSSCVAAIAMPTSRRSGKAGARSVGLGRVLLGSTCSVSGCSSQREDKDTGSSLDCCYSHPMHGNTKLSWCSLPCPQLPTPA